MSTVKKLPKKLTPEQWVDELGRIKADIAELEKEEKTAVTTLKEHGCGVYCGKLFEANVFEQERNKRIDYAALAKAAKIDPRLIKKYTTTVVPEPVTTIDWETVIKLSDVDPEMLKKHTTADKIQVCKVTARS